ncbi:MAG: carbohydrate ABC transporter permease, partial [Streptosporangiaceae bacterium]
GQLFSAPPWVPAIPPTLGNFIALFQSGFLHYIVNSVVLTVLLVVGELFFTTLAAYAFARLRFPGRDVLFWVYVATLMVPNAVTLIPLYLIMRQLGWVNTWFGLVGPFILGTPYGVFLMRQYLRTIPRDLEEAALIDGAGRLTILVRVILPLSRPILGTLAIITTVFSWNKFMWPLIITSDQNTQPVTVGIAVLQGKIGTHFGLLMAGSFVALVPMVAMYLAFQRYIVRSIMLTGLK